MVDDKGQGDFSKTKPEARTWRGLARASQLGHCGIIAVKRRMLCELGKLDFGVLRVCVGRVNFVHWFIGGLFNTMRSFCMRELV